MNKLPISAVISSVNEGDLLDACLESISFCDEIILIDQMSTDNTAEVAKKYKVLYFLHERVKIIEKIHAKFCPKTKHNWILLVDPDEVYDSELVADIFSLFEHFTNSLDFAEIRVPIRYYFKNKALKGTMWGGDKIGRSLVNREFQDFTSLVHSGYKNNSESPTFVVKKTGSNVIHHYWMQSHRQLFDKHMRYLQEEGISLAMRGIKYSPIIQLKHTWKSLFQSLIHRKGYRDGMTGLYLSFFWAWYVFMKWNSLRKYEKSLAN